MKKILFSLVALVCSMSMNAQVMKVMKDGVEVAKYKGAEYSVVFEEAPAVENPFSWSVGDAILLMDGTNSSKYNYVSGDGNTLSSFALADGQTAVSGANIYALYPYAKGTVSETRNPTQADAEAAAGNYSRNFDFWRMLIGDGHEDMAINDMQRSNISAENQAIILAYLKGESATIVTPGVELDGSSIKSVVIPAEQTAIADAADPQASVRVAKADGENLIFADVCAYIKVTPQFDCSAIALTSKGDELLAGKVDINYNNGAPTTTVTADGTNTVYLVGTITAGNAYYIAVRPETLASGYTIEFLTADKGTYYAQSTGNAFELEGGSVNDLGEFTASSSWTISSPTTGNDGAGHNWMLIAPTLKISTPTEFGTGVAYNDLVVWPGWAVPTADELSEAGKSGAFGYDYDVEKIFIKGTGVLKYGKIHHVNNIRWYFWTSTPYDNPYFPGYQTRVLIRDGSIGGYDPSSAGDTGYIFKYNN